MLHKLLDGGKPNSAKTGSQSITSANPVATGERVAYTCEIIVTIVAIYSLYTCMHTHTSALIVGEKEICVTIDEITPCPWTVWRECDEKRSRFYATPRQIHP